jgi:hypothetical protein
MIPEKAKVPLIFFSWALGIFLYTKTEVSFYVYFFMIAPFLILAYFHEKSYEPKTSKLFKEAWDNNYDGVKRLIEKGEDVNCKDYEERTALMGAACNGNLKLLKLLIDNGADVNYGRHTALMWANQENHPEVIKLLIDNGADVNAKNKWGGTALTSASYMGHYKIVKLLLDNGADEIDNALWQASESERDNHDIIELLKEAGAKESSGENMKCPACKSELKAGTHECDYCGIVLSETSEIKKSVSPLKTAPIKKEVTLSETKEQWYYSQDGKTKNGPLSKEELEKVLSKHSANKNTLLWRPGFSEWQPLNKVKEININSTATPPPLPNKLAGQQKVSTTKYYNILLDVHGLLEQYIIVHDEIFNRKKKGIVQSVFKPIDFMSLYKKVGVIISQLLQCSKRITSAIHYHPEKENDFLTELPEYGFLRVLSEYTQALIKAISQFKTILARLDEKAIHSKRYNRKAYNNDILKYETARQQYMEIGIQLNKFQ